MEESINIRVVRAKARATLEEKAKTPPENQHVAEANEKALE